MSLPTRRLADNSLPLALVLLLMSEANATWPDDAATRALVVGKPQTLRIAPAEMTLVGPRAGQQVVVTGLYADGTVRDLTGLCEFQVHAESVAAVDRDGYVRPLKNGTATLVVQAGGQTAQVPVRVQALEQSRPVSFRQELIAALNVGGCNAGACHGTPSGKGGFRLSLRGFDPPADYVQLTRDVFGRRTDRQGPEASLVWQKALGQVPHEGGPRFQPTALAAQALRGWLADGLPDDPPDLPALKRIEVLPGSRVLVAPARWQQVAVLAHFADGTSRDVTRLSVFSSSEPSVADVASTGLVEFRQAGEVAILCRYLDEMQSIRLTYLQPRPDFVWSNPPENNFVDRHVFAKLRQLHLLPSDLATDEEFLRRVYLDVCGILPTAQEARAFLADTAPDKRQRLIDHLLDRPEYADFWTLKWCDVLRSNRKTIQAKGTHVFQQWLKDHLRRNTPLNQVVRELLTAQGSTFANPPANYYRIARDPHNLAETTAQLFFGVRLQCAKCHNHPFEHWTQDDYYSMAAFFSRVRQKPDPDQPGTGKEAREGAEVVYNDRAGEVTQPRTGQVMPPRYLGGAPVQAAAGQDRRALLADWITAPDNPFFAKSIVNRLWFHVMGRGIVDPVDDFRDSNPPANDELLEALARDFVAHGFDVKHTLRTILRSRTYQLSARTNELNKHDGKYFSHAVTRPLAAEQLLDAICAATDVPEKFPGLPLGTRAVQLPDGEINHNFLKTFGQPGRELPCECERESDSNLSQALQLINGPTINEKIRNPDNRLGKLLARKLPDRQVLDELYLAALSRPPVASEVQAALEHVAQAADKRKAWEDVQWAIINSKEFLFRH